MLERDPLIVIWEKLYAETQKIMEKNCARINNEFTQVWEIEETKMFRRKNSIVSAIQWHPPGTANHQEIDGAYKTYEGIWWFNDTALDDGDWIVTDSKGQQYHYSNEEFHDQFEEAA